MQNSIQSRLEKKGRPATILSAIYIYIYIYIYKTDTQSGAGISLFQFCLTTTKPFSSLYLQEIKSY